LETDTADIPRILAKQHSVANMLQVHVLHFDAILGPKDSLLTQITEMRANFQVMRADIDSIKETIKSIRSDVAQILESHELQKANVVGQWQMRATMATAIIASLSAMAVAALQFM
jgi:hypothetical protein